jgi:hypothetical protein
MAKLKLGLSRRLPENLVALARHVLPKEPPAAPENLVVTAGDHDRTLDAACDPVAKARSCVWEVTTMDPVAGPYVPAGPTTASRTTLTGLTSGTRVWVRVAAVGSKGIGPWSESVSKLVP